MGFIRYVAVLVFSNPAFGRGLKPPKSRKPQENRGVYLYRRPRLPQKLEPLPWDDPASRQNNIRQEVTPFARPKAFFQQVPRSLNRSVLGYTTLSQVSVNDRRFVLLPI